MVCVHRMLASIEVPSPSPPSVLTGDVFLKDEGGDEVGEGGEAELSPEFHEDLDLCVGRSIEPRITQ